MSSHMSLALSVGGTFISHPAVFVAMFKYIFTNGWGYPFYAMIFLNGALFLSSIAYFIYKFRAYDDVRQSFFIFGAKDLIQISALYCGEVLLCAYSLFQEHMDTVRYLMMSTPFDFLFLGAASSVVMHRPLSPSHWAGVILGLFGFLIYDILRFEGDKQTNWDLNFNLGWQGPLCCFGSRFCHVFMCMITKKMIMKKGFIEKSRLQKELDELKPPLDADDLDVDGNLKQRIVSLDSILAKRAIISKKKNEVQKAAEIMMLQERLEQERVRIEKRRDDLINDYKKRGTGPPPEMETQQGMGANFVEELIQKNKKKKKKNRAMIKFEEDLKKKFQEINGPISKPLNDTAKQEFVMNNQVENQLEADKNANLNMIQREKLKLQELLDEEKLKHVELEMMLADYEEIPFFLHFFNGMDDIMLSKLDNIIDHPMYDIELVGYNKFATFELYGIGGSLALFPMACLCSFFSGEVPEAYQKMASSQIKGPFGDTYVSLILACVFSLIYAARPWALHRFVYATNAYIYYAYSCFIHIFVLFYSIIFVDTKSTVYSTFGAGAMLNLGAYLAFFVIVSFTYSHAESLSSIELIKSILPANSEDEQHNVLEMRLLEIRRILGIDALYRILIDMAVSRNPNCLLYTASASLPSRVLFDKEYFYRVADWGGGYPRPFVEAAEKTWRSLDGEGVVVPNDPELEQEAFRRREKKRIQEEKKMEKMKRIAEEENIRLADLEDMKRLREEEEQMRKAQEELDRIERMKQLEQARKYREMLEREAQEKLEKDVKQLVSSFLKHQDFSCWCLKVP